MYIYLFLTTTLNIIICDKTVYRKSLLIHSSNVGCLEKYACLNILDNLFL